MSKGSIQKFEKDKCKFKKKVMPKETEGEGYDLKSTIRMTPMMTSIYFWKLEIQGCSILHCTHL
jgi:hypothetical protein